MTNTVKVVLRGTGIKKYFPMRSSVLNRVKRSVKAVDGVDISLHEGEAYGLMGKTGCGKSTLGRTLAYLTEPADDSIEVLDQDMTAVKRHQLIEMHRKIQMVLRDPYISLDSKQRVDDILTEALKIHSIGTHESRMDAAVEITEKVGLQLGHFYRRPHEFSGDQRQRIGLARALVLSPKIIICDEPVSALDIPIQAQIINLLQDPREKEQISFLFIAHDMSVIEYVSDRVRVMYLKHIMEEAETEELFHNTLHPYAKALLSAIPNPLPHTKKERVILKGDLSSPINLPPGCVLHARCPYATEQYSMHTPHLKKAVPSHRIACLICEEGWSGQT